MLNLMQEKRCLKRSRLGVPDIYPQDAKQKEDELTSTNVKHGFSSGQQVAEEFGTARNCNVTASKVGAYFNAILAKREELTTLPDSGRKKQQINPKDNFWPVTGRNSKVDMWFRDLAGNKALISLAKKAPYFNKKEEIFTYLSDHQVSMQKAAWFIKLSSAYTVAVSEAKIKKRQMPDPATEWTGTLIKFMKELLPKLHDHYHHQGAAGSPALSGVDVKPSASAGGSSTTLNASPLTPGGVPAPLTSPASSVHSPNHTTAASTPLQSGHNSSGSQHGGSPSQEHDCRNELRHWHYCTQLIKYLYEEALLDRHEFLHWILDLLDRMRSHPTTSDGLLKLYLPLTLQYMFDFVQSERLSRRLAYLVAKKLTHVIASAMEANDIASGTNLALLFSPSAAAAAANGTVVTVATNTNGAPITSIDALLSEYLSCPHHRDVVLQLSTILQIITIECPSALVWCGLGENRAPSALVGSALDHLQLPPSALPMPVNCATSTYDLQRQLEVAEAKIRVRSVHAEAKWCTEKWQNRHSNSNAKILATLDALDTHCFDRLDANSTSSAANNLDTLYARVFPAFQPTRQEMVKGEMKESRVTYDVAVDAAVVRILCEWAVSAQRWGEHRAMAVAWLLDKRQSEVMIVPNETCGVGSGGAGANGVNDDKDSVGSGGVGGGGNGGGYSGVPVFQAILMRFLDTDAPVLDEHGSVQQRAQFTNLVHLFCELIRHDVFSHDAYMCTLISRGDLLTTGYGYGCAASAASKMSGGGSSAAAAAATAGNPAAGPSMSSAKTSPHGGRQSAGGLGDDDMYPSVPFSGDFDDNVDDDLDKLLQNINREQMDAPDSPKDTSDTSHGDHQHRSSGGAGNEPPVSRHFLYAKHFPLCQDDPLSQHDCNQRYILLFGVGKERDEKKHAVKKMSKEICKLFSKKFSIDVAEGGKVKKHSRNEFNFEATTHKCQALSFFDQHVVTWQCTVTVQEMLNSFAMGNSNYLPVHEHVAFLFDLMEMALNIYGLIDMCIQILKELPEVEAQLLAKSSILVRSYTTCLSLYAVGVLRRYHCCLLLSIDQTAAVFEGLCKVVKHVSNPADCSSAERCILAYLFDLYSSCSLLKAKPPPTEPFHNAYPKIKQALYASVVLVAAAHPYNMMFMADVLANPKRGGKIEPAWGRQLAESAANRYSFVCNALIAASREQDNDRLNDMAAMCAELTACCNALSVEWLCALIALCGSSNETYYTDILAHIDIQNVAIHNSLAVFTCILVARHCFTLEKFVFYVALPALVNACNGGREITPEAEAGARLSCHLLLRLFKTVEIPQPGMYSVGTSPNPITVPGPQACNIKLSCDRHLLAAAHKSIAVGPVLAVLKGILVVGDATCQHKPTLVSSTASTYSGGKRSGLNTPVHPGSTPKSMGAGGVGAGVGSVGGNSGGVGCGGVGSVGGGAGPIDLSHILGTSDLGILGDADEPMLDLSHLNVQSGVQNENTSSLSDFAQHVLRQICSQEWILERCLQNPEDLCQNGMIIDPMLTAKQAQRLLHMICYPDTDAGAKAELDQAAQIVRILENLEQWSIRISLLDLTLMFKQTSKNSPEQSCWLDMVARAAIDVFHDNDDTSAAGTMVASHSGSNARTIKKKSSIWLVAPLVAKLGKEVQGRILRVAGNVLESTPFFCCTKKQKEESNDDSNGSNDGTERQPDEIKPPQLSHKAFLGLILTCLKAQDDQKEDLLSSLHTQLTQFLAGIQKFESVGGIKDPQGREEMLDALQLRFSLVGGMFDAIQKNSTPVSDWAILLTQLMCQSAIDLTTNSELFTTALDMLATLIHSTLISDSQTERDENKKHYTNLMKKLKKELGDKCNSSVRFVRQLLPLSKQTCEVIACESAGCLTDTKGNKISGFDSIDKKPGLRLSDKQRLNVWDLLEGHKNPAPLSWAWVGAVKMERRPLAYEETHRLLKYHTHSLVKPSSYYYEPLPLPPEELEPLPAEKQAKDDLHLNMSMKVDTPSSVDQSPSGASGGGGGNGSGGSGVGTGRGRGKGAKRAKKSKAPTPVTMVPGVTGTAGGAGQQTPQQLQQQQQQQQQLQQQMQVQQQQQQQQQHQQGHPQQGHPQHMQNQHQMQHMQQQQHMGQQQQSNNPMHMQMNMQNQGNPNMQQHMGGMQSNQMMNAMGGNAGGGVGGAPGSMNQGGINAQVQQVPAGMSGVGGVGGVAGVGGFGNQQQQQQMGGVSGPGGVGAGGPQNQQQWNQFNSMQQPQHQQQQQQLQQQQFHNQQYQGMAQMNRPNPNQNQNQNNQNPKQLLSRMLISRNQPGGGGGVGAGGGQFNVQQQQQQQQQQREQQLRQQQLLQQQQQQQQQNPQFVRNAIRPMNPNIGGAGGLPGVGVGGVPGAGGPVAGVGVGMGGSVGGGMNPNAMMNAGVAGAQMSGQQGQHQQGNAGGQSAMGPNGGVAGVGGMGGGIGVAGGQAGNMGMAGQVAGVGGGMMQTPLGQASGGSGVAGGGVMGGLVGVGPTSSGSGVGIPIGSGGGGGGNAVGPGMLGNQQQGMNVGPNVGMGGGVGGMGVGGGGVGGGGNAVGPNNNMGQQQGVGGGGGGGPNQGMFGGQQQQQFGGMGQNFGGGGYNQPQQQQQGMGPQGGVGAGGGGHPGQNMPMGNFNQMSSQQRTQAEYMAQQRSMSMQQQQQNRGQFMQPVPNVTMNNMVGQGAAPPYPRQGQAGGKPGMASGVNVGSGVGGGVGGGGGGSVVTPQQQQQYAQQQRMRQQQLLMQQQQQQGGGMGQQGMQPNQGQGQQQGPQQGMVGQQTPALVAQLQQRQLPNQQQQQQSMMNQPYGQHGNQQY